MIWDAKWQTAKLQTDQYGDHSNYNKNKNDMNNNMKKEEEEQEFR